MSRSAADATRFTATGPYASSKSSAAPYKLPGFLADSRSKSSPNSQHNGSGGNNRQETPKDKVDRLRAQARAARIAQSTSRMDQAVDFGRRFANKAHKTMVYTLIAASGICGALTVYSMISLTLYNRRQRELWIEKELKTLHDAQTAAVNGSATLEQLELLKKEKIGEIVKEKREEEKAQRPWYKAKAMLFGGLKTEETPSSNAAAGNVESNKPRVLEALSAADPKLSQASPSATSPGQLDTLAENAETAAKQTTRSWKSWLTGR
ncbi:cytochrome oxidase c assembly-domain-containing protein [Aspergillus cavernicola]|uniref:Cytochrome oxidase c assembly-domain-containing protein n=1 Tax=Aspergillus cavernicola TaxID=176166 RepID=A0ABR4IA29_9EURO